MTPELTRFLSTLIPGASDAEAVKDAFTEYVRSQGVDHFIIGYGVYNEDGSERALEFLTSLPDSYLTAYHGVGMMKQDLIVRMTRELTPDNPQQTVHWGVEIARDMQLPLETRQMFQLLGEHGMRSGITYFGREYRGGEQRGYGVSFGTGPENDVEGRQRIEANSDALLIAAFALWPTLSQELRRRMLDLNDVILSDSELKVLKGLAASGRLQDVADSTGLTMRSVDNHSRAIRTKLNAVNSLHAVAISYQIGLLS